MRQQPSNNRTIYDANAKSNKLATSRALPDKWRRRVACGRALI